MNFQFVCFAHDQLTDRLPYYIATQDLGRKSLPLLLINYMQKRL